MVKKAVLAVLVIYLVIFCLTSCRQVKVKDDYLILFNDTINNGYGYKDLAGTIVIAPGKYPVCFTDTFMAYGVVATNKNGIVAINRQEKVLYEVFAFDNGPDEPSDGLFRITQNHKIGYADAVTGGVMIAPRFSCANPFMNGVAEVSDTCLTLKEGEHSSWKSNNWYFIDKSGSRVVNAVRH